MSIARDIDGVALIDASERAGALFALGYLHSQERFFQMDLLRRSAAGEQAALLGEGLLAADRRARLHRFRMRAQGILAGLCPTQAAIVETYRLGVNAGLNDLRAAPWEYRLLRSTPEPWRGEDTLLVMHAIFLQLADGMGEQEFQRHLLFANLSPVAAAFLSASGAPGDLPMVGPAPSSPRIPMVDDIDLARCELGRLRHWRPMRRPPNGSNGWALSASNGDSDGAMLANDVHLPFAMPNLFFRAALTCGAEKVAGFTIPGLPFVLAGSNGHVAWGITNAAVRTGRLIAIDPAGPGTTRYRSLDGDQAPLLTTETILVRGAAPQSLCVSETAWGPIVRRSRAGIDYALQWSAHDPAAVDMGWRAIETARSVDQALDAANAAGGPPLAMVFADDAGKAGWTVAGHLAMLDDAPLDAAMRSSRLAAGPLRTAPGPARPRVVVADGGCVWSANALSITQGRGADLIRHGPNNSGARAAQLGRALLAMRDPADFADMEGLQLDTHAPGMRYWQVVLEQSLAAGPRKSIRSAIAEAVQRWDGHASAASAAYRIVRLFREETIALILEPFVAHVRSRSGEPFDLMAVSDHLEFRATELLDAKPAHLLAPWFTSWAALLEEAVDRVERAVETVGGIGAFSWGAINRLDMKYPFARLLPTDCGPPAQPLSGDADLPLAQTARHGPLYRFVVRPGCDFVGTVQMAGGQSSNPAAPYYLAGHDRWAAGVSTPFRGQKAVWRLALVPG